MKLVILKSLLISALSLTATAETMNHDQHMSQMMKKHTSTTPIEYGQSSFAAIAEITKILSENTETDWSKVNINALRKHLLDMNNLMTGAKVEEHEINNGMRFEVTGEDDVLEAIHRMVPAHSKQLNQLELLTVTTKANSTGISMTVTSNNEATQLKVKGLGFFGLMTMGSHHQPHHLMIATGQSHKLHH